MLKSEFANRLINLIALWGLVTFVLLNDNGISVDNPASIIITIVLAILGTTYHLYKLFKLNKE